MKHHTGFCAARLARILCCCCVLQGFTAVRIATADSGNVEDILPLANDPNDPIGLERDPGFDRAAAVNTRQTASTAPSTPEDRARFGPTPPPFAAKSGEALTAVPSVRELTHRTNLELYAGLALLETELSFENSADKPAEVEYRLAVPDDAALAGLDACNLRGCRNGTLAPATERGAAYDDAIRARGAKPLQQQLPLAHAYKVRDARGAALIVRAAAVERDLPLTVRLRYATAAPVHGGVARLRLATDRHSRKRRRRRNPQRVAVPVRLPDVRAGVCERPAADGCGGGSDLGARCVALHRRRRAFAHGASDLRDLGSSATRNSRACAALCFEGRAADCRA